MIPEKIPTVLGSKEIIEKSFKNTNRVQDIYKPNFLDKLKTLSIEKIKIMEATSKRVLNRIYNGFPKIDDLDRFEKDMLFILVNGREYERALNNVRWATSKITEFATNSIRGIKKARNQDAISRFRSSFYGRFASVIEDLDESLSILRNAREKFKELPSMRTDLKTVIIAGFPNVGKSSLISKLTNLKPKIAQYPFTTEGINQGMMKAGNQLVQVLDVPGLLNRREHNQIEKKAIAAINNIGSLVICLMDPSEVCGYRIEDQKNLCETLKSEGKNVFIVENKSDLVDTKSENLKISCFTGAGIEELRMKIGEKLHD